MAREPITVSLGGEDFTVNPLTLDQLSDIEIALRDTKTEIAKAKAVILAALAKDYPELATDGIVATLGEAGTALNAILRYAGFLPDAPKLAEAPEAA